MFVGSLALVLRLSGAYIYAVAAGSTQFPGDGPAGLAMARVLPTAFSTSFRNAFRWAKLVEAASSLSPTCRC